MAEAPRPDGDMDPIYAALLIACREEGYDSSHERRKELVVILEHAQAGGDFPPNIMTRVTDKTKKSEAEALRVLKPQVHRVLEAMRAAVKQEDERLAELKRLEEEAARAEEEAERQRILQAKRDKEAEHQRVQERLRICGACPMGYSWHPCGGGWRCAGGSHYMSDADLPRL